MLLADEVAGVEAGSLEPRPGAVPTARSGDMFQLGPHRVICGDARDPETLKRLMEGDEPARIVLTDPPFNVRNPPANVTGGPHREFAMAVGEMNEAEFLDF